MKKCLPLLLLIAFVASCVKDRTFTTSPYRLPGTPALGNRTIIHYWNFNGSSLTTPTQTTGGAAFYYTGGGAYDAVSPGSTLNARNADAAGSGLRLRNPAGTFTLNLPTSNYTDIVLSFAAQRSSSGAQQNTLYYSVDGTNFITDSLVPNITQLDTIWQSYYYDLTAIKRANDNPNFKVQFKFAVNDTGTSGNDRFDNIALDGNIITPIPPAAPQIIHYWNFNNTASITDAVTPTFTIGGGALSYTGGVWDSYLVGSPVNARNGDTAGASLRVRNPSVTFCVAVPTTGFKNIKLTMEVQRSSSGAQTNTITYTTDGVNYISTGIATNTYTPDLDPSYKFVTYDFSGIAGIDNNPNFKINIDFSNGSTGTSGNNRFDNIVLEGTHL